VELPAGGARPHGLQAAGEVLVPPDAPARRPGLPAGPVAGPPGQRPLRPAHQVSTRLGFFSMSTVMSF